MKGHEIYRRADTAVLVDQLGKDYYIFITVDFESGRTGRCFEFVASKKRIKKITDTYIDIANTLGSFSSLGWKLMVHEYKWLFGVEKLPSCEKDAEIVVNANRHRPMTKREWKRIKACLPIVSAPDYKNGVHKDLFEFQKVADKKKQEVFLQQLIEHGENTTTNVIQTKEILRRMEGSEDTDPYRILATQGYGKKR